MRKCFVFWVLCLAMLLPKTSWGATADEYYRAGLDQAKAGAHDKAVAYFKAALQADPNHWQSDMAMGNSYYAQHQLPEAVAAYDESLRLHPDNPSLSDFVAKLKASHPELAGSGPAPAGAASSTTLAPITKPIATSKKSDLDPQWIIWLGPATLPYKMTGVMDVALSDWEYYGTGFLEGRIGLPLSKALGTKTYVGGEIGGEYFFKPRLSAVIEGRMVFKNSLTSQFALLLGGGLHFVKTPKFSLAIVPKIGFGSIDVDFGESYVLPGYMPPVVLPEGTIYDGTNITAHSGGFLVEGSLQGYLRFSERIGLYGRVGYMKSFMGALKIKAGDIEIANNSPALVLDNGGTTPANLDPKDGMDGMTAMIGLAIFR